MRSRRLRRRGQHGLTLIEMLVTIVIITVGVVGIVGGLASAQLSASIIQTQSQLEVAMRQASDYVRDSTSGGLTYQTCASASAYQSAVRQKVSIPGVSIAVKGVRVSPVNDGSGSGGNGEWNGTATPPISGCGSSTADWGVQEVTVEVTDQHSGRTLTWNVWKSDPQTS